MRNAAIPLKGYGHGPGNKALHEPDGVGHKVLAQDPRHHAHLVRVKLVKQGAEPVI